jgi:hypothetical protein
LKFVSAGDDELPGLVLLDPDQLLHRLVRLHRVQVPATQQVHFALHLKGKKSKIFIIMIVLMIFMLFLFEKYWGKR